MCKRHIFKSMECHTTPKTSFFVRLSRKDYSAASIRKTGLNNAVKRKATIVELGDELEACIAAPSDTESQYESDHIAQTISTFLKKLPPEKRNVFVRRYWFADSIFDLANRFSISESKVKSMLFRTRKELREYL